MNPLSNRLMPLFVSVAISLPASAHADEASARSSPASEGEAIEVAGRTRRPAARPTRRPAARHTAMRRGYRPVSVRRAPVYRPARGRVVYAPVYRPRARYAPMVAGGGASAGIAYLTIGGQLASIANSDAATSGFASGAGFEIGYGLRPTYGFALEAAFGMTFHDIAGASSDLGTVGHLTFDTRFYLGEEDRALHPYLLIGLGAAFTDRSDTADPGLGGLGLQAGGGFDYFLTEGVSLGVKGTWRGAFVDDSGDSFSGVATRSGWLSTFNLGTDLKFYF